jgi:ABC-type multidrug transport system, ATPase component
MESAIKAISLTKRYGNFTAVDHINFEVYYDEIFGFLGPNGAGKTTTIKMLTTVTRPSEGTAVVNGYDVIKQSAKVRESIGVVPQEYTADEDLTGWENLMLIAALMGYRRVRLGRGLLNYLIWLSCHMRLIGRLRRTREV